MTSLDDITNITRVVQGRVRAVRTVQFGQLSNCLRVILLKIVSTVPETFGKINCSFMEYVQVINV